VNASLPGLWSPELTSVLSSFPVPSKSHSRDGYATPRAGTLHYVDAVLPWRFEDPTPPPVPPKSELRVRPAASAENIPKRVTPWLLRHVKAPESHVTRPPQKAVADIMGSPKPPAYELVQQQQPKEERPSGERPRTSPQSHNLPKLASLPALQTTVRAPAPAPAPAPDYPLPPIPAPPTKPDKSDKRKEPVSGSVSHAYAPQSSGRGRHEERPRPRTKSSPRPAPVPATVVPVPQPTHTHARSFPEPPSYRSAAGESSLPSARSKSLPRSRKKSSTFEKDAPLPPLPNHPPLPSSAMSRIHAAYKVSNEFGNAVMRQESRLATPLPDVAPTPRVGQRFMTASEIQSLRKSRQRATKGSAERQTYRGH
jgi:hypothetical protein